MGNIGDTFPYSVPTVGSAGPTYATTINQILNELIARASAKVPLSSVSFASDLNLNAQAVTNASYVSFQNSATTPGSSPVCRITCYNGDFWYVSPSGAIQLTTGSALNAAGVGGITGAYGGANPPQFRYESGTTRYDAYANYSTNTWAYIRSLGFDIAGGATSSAYARLAFNGSVNRTYTLPSAPASTADRPLSMDTAGNIVVGHGARTYNIPITASPLASASLTNGIGTYAVGGGPSLSIYGIFVNTAYASTNPPAFSIPITGLAVGQRILSVAVDIGKVNTSNTTWVLFKCVNSVVSTVTGANASTSVAGLQTLTLTPSTPETVVAGAYYSLGLSNYGPNAASETWSGCRVTVDQPV